MHINNEDFDIVGFDNQFQQVILNLLNNSKDAFLANNIKNAEITITIERENSIGYLKIKDNAGGIHESIIDRIFEPYFTTKDQGIGLGLYMSKLIIEKNMNATLDVRNYDDGVEFIIKTDIF